MKRKIPLFILAVLLVALIGCSRLKTRIENCTPWETETSFGMNYSCFDGGWSKDVKLEVPTAIKVEVHTDGGMLKLEIAKTGQEPIYTGKMTEDCSFTVNAQPGEYTISLTGDNHAGRVELKWGSDDAAGTD